MSLSDPSSGIIRGLKDTNMNDTTTFTAARRAARERGEKFFTLATPCKYGHISKRYASTGGCVACLVYKSPTPPTPVQQPFTLHTVVALNFTDEDRVELETYLVKCVYAFSEARGKPMPFEPYRIAWAEEHKRSVRECPL